MVLHIPPSQEPRQIAPEYNTPIDNSGNPSGKGFSAIIANNIDLTPELPGSKKITIGKEDYKFGSGHYALPEGSTFNEYFNTRGSFPSGNQAATRAFQLVGADFHEIKSLGGWADNTFSNSVKERALTLSKELHGLKVEDTTAEKVEDTTADKKALYKKAVYKAEIELLDSFFTDVQGYMEDDKKSRNFEVVFLGKTYEVSLPENASSIKEYLTDEPKGNSEKSNYNKVFGLLINPNTDLPITQVDSIDGSFLDNELEKIKEPMNTLKDNLNKIKDENYDEQLKALQAFYSSVEP